MKLSSDEEKNFLIDIDELLQSKRIYEMQKYIQHGNTSTFKHCLLVAYYSYWLCQRLPMKFDIRSVARGGLLHDFYLYDWHIPDQSHRLHGFFHPYVALNNASELFHLNCLEKDIIRSHMWPLTIRNNPRSREALVVCLVDKFCSFTETFYIPIRPKDYRDICSAIEKMHTQR